MQKRVNFLLVKIVPGENRGRGADLASSKRIAPVTTKITSRTIWQSFVVRVRGINNKIFLHHFRDEIPLTSSAVGVTIVVSVRRARSSATRCSIILQHALPR